MLKAKEYSLMPRFQLASDERPIRLKRLQLALSEEVPESTRKTHF